MDNIMVVFEQFSQDHSRIAKVVKLIEHEADVLAQGGDVDFLLLSDCFEYIRAYPDQFHHPFEDIMFRRLRQRSSESAADIQRLLLEHQELASLSARLSAQLAAVIAGQPTDRAALAQNLHEYVGLNRSHMRFEEQRAFPAARRHLGEADWRDVAAVMRAMHEDTVSGGAASEKSFEQLFQRIQDEAALHDA